MSKEVLLEMRTIKREEFIEWFRQIGGIETKPGTFEGPFWKACVSEPWEVKLGAMNFSSLYVNINVKDDKLEDFMKKFRLRFLRAGG